MSANYSLSRRDQLLRHFPADSHVFRDGAMQPYDDVTVRVRSDQYFASWAMTLENLCDDPYIDIDTFKYIMRKLAEELLYLQDVYKLTRRH